MGGSSGGVQNFDMSSLASSIPSVFNGPYNVAGAEGNANNLAQQYPWITPSNGGNFAGAQPGQWPTLGAGGTIQSGTSAQPPGGPQVGPTVPANTTMNPMVGGPNPMQQAQKFPNSFTPTPIQAILQSLMGSAGR